MEKRKQRILIPSGQLKRIRLGEGATTTPMDTCCFFAVQGRVKGERVTDAFHITESHMTKFLDKKPDGTAPVGLIEGLEDAGKHHEAVTVIWHPKDIAKTLVDNKEGNVRVVIGPGANVFYEGSYSTDSKRARAGYEELVRFFRNLEKTDKRITVEEMKRMHKGKRAGFGGVDIYENGEFKFL